MPPTGICPPCAPFHPSRSPVTVYEYGIGENASTPTDPSRDQSRAPHQRCMGAIRALDDRNTHEQTYESERNGAARRNSRGPIQTTRGSKATGRLIVPPTRRKVGGDSWVQPLSLRRFDASIRRHRPPMHGWPTRSAGRPRTWRVTHPVARPRTRTDFCPISLKNGSIKPASRAWSADDGSRDWVCQYKEPSVRLGEE